MADRTRKSIKNAQISLFYYFVQIILGFWSRKVFFEYLGSEILGLDTTATNLLSFLNLAEMGISTAVGFFLYKPLYDHDTKSINEIVALEGWIYRRVAYVIICAAVILMGFFPLIFAKSAIPLWCAYATFLVMLFGSMLGYFINYKMIVLGADQKAYKVTIVTQGASVFFKILLILLLPIVSYPFVFYLSTNTIGHLFGCVWLNRVLKKEYPWLSVKGHDGKSLFQKYPDVMKKTKQVFIHRISGTILNQAAPLIMYAYTSLTIIAYYGNYMLVITKMSQLLGTVFGSTGAAIGNLIASGDKERIKKVFWELFDSRLFMSWTALFCIYYLIEPFIRVWLGEEYLLSKELLIIMLVSFSIVVNRTTVDSFIWGSGLFHDILAPITESVINLVASLTLGYYWGIEGVLLGGIISQSFFIGVWKPYFLFAEGIKESPFSYFIPFLGRCVVIGICFFVLYFATAFIDLKSIDSYEKFIQYGLVVFVEVVITLFIMFYIFTSGMKAFVSRVYALSIAKLNKFRKI